MSDRPTKPPSVAFVSSLLQQAAAPRQHGPRCGVSKALNALPEDVASVLREALRDVETYSQPGLQRVFAELGFNVPASTIGKHRRKQCACE